MQQRKTVMNTLKEVEFRKLWLPLIIYYNTDQEETTRLCWITEWRTHITVSRKYNFTRSRLDEADEIELFRGSENSLNMLQIYTHEFQCRYYLHHYPFDKQEA